MRTILIITIIFLHSIVMQAADIRPIEKGLIEVAYNKHVVRDTLNRDTKFIETPMKLRIGKDMAMFYSIKKMWADSLRYHNLELYAHISIENEKKGGGLMKGYETETVYSNFPKDKITVTGSFDMELWEYEEDLSYPVWTILSESKNILGYNCQKAMAIYKGREWTAWFCTDFPINFGPWKLHGLPGLILEVYDKKRDYVFTAVSIGIADIPDVGYYQYNRGTPTKISRDKYLQSRYKTINKDNSFGIRQAFGYTEPGEKPNEVKANYDFEEIDYPH